MSIPNPRTRPPALLLCVAVLAMPALALAEGPTDEDCLACHTDAKGRAAGKTVKVFDLEKWQGSIHGELSISCTDCHADLAGATMPHAEKLAPAQCASCHEKASVSYQKGVHSLARSDGKGVSASCTDCHGGGHEILPSGDRRAPTHHLNQIATCARCHDDAKLVQAVELRGGIVKTYVDSIHGRGVSEAGLVVAPTCATCHGFHEVLRHDDPKSPVSRANEAATCGRCHQGVEEKYRGSVHAQVAKEGKKDAPTCSGCHTAHGIRHGDLAEWKLDVIAECGTCHEESLTGYRSTFHGRITDLGFARMAKCADCHGAHDIVAKTDPRSPVVGANLIATCKTCHKGASASFVEYDVHANPHNKARNPMVYWVNLAMQLLLAGVMTVFGLHTVLWLARGLVDKWRIRKGGL